MLVEIVLQWWDFLQSLPWTDGQNAALNRSYEDLRQAVRLQREDDQASPSKLIAAIERIRY